jgi:HSP20 family protein
MKAQMKKEEPVKAAPAKAEPVKAEAPAKHFETVKPEVPAKHVAKDVWTDWMNPFPTMWNWFEDMEKMMPDFGLMNRLAPRFYPPDLFRPALRMFRETPLWNDLADLAAKWTPQAELMRRDNELIVRLDLPGVKKEDIKVDIEDHKLVIHGERRDEMEDKREGYYRSERTYGSFYRAIPLPDDVKTDKAEAFFDNGVLEVKIEVPKPKGKGKRLEIK